MRFSPLNYHVDLTDLKDCKVFDKDGSLIKRGLTAQQAFDLRHSLYEKEVEDHNKRAEKIYFKDCIQLSLF